MIRTSHVLLVLLTCVEAVAAQVAPPADHAGRDAAALVRVDSLYEASDVSGSLAAAEALVAGDPVGSAAWRAARAAVILGMLADAEQEQNDWFYRGETYAAKAVAADSLSMDALFWLTAAKGRLALQASARDAARLGNEVWRLAHKILAMDPNHAGAHNVLGTLQYEVMTLSRFERFLARTFLGESEALRRSSWEGAEEEHRAAVALDPDAILYRYQLARTLARRDRPDEAVAELRTVLALPRRYPADGDVQDDARRMLQRLGEEP
jgi:tetratricopeptide (TPR) repeat protein